MTALFYEDITVFMELIRKQRFDEAEKEMKRKRREVGQAKKRMWNLTVSSSAFMMTTSAARSATNGF